MQTGAITSYFDVAQITLYAFWLFFAGLIFYLRREDKREGYPLISDRSDQVVVQGLPEVPAPKSFILPHGGVTLAPREEPIREFAAVPGAAWPGAPIVPTGNPMVDGIGPAAWAWRSDEPDLAFDDGQPKIVPLRAAADFFLAWEDPDPRGMLVLGADGEIAGTVVDVWVDRSEVVIRYLEMSLSGVAGSGNVLVPMNFVDISRKAGQIRVGAILAAQFAQVPRLARPDVISLLEEDKVCAYYGGGTLFATPQRAEPLL